MGNIISKNNAKILKKAESPTNKETESCNCNNKDTCPPPGRCRVKGVVYHATVTTPTSTETYIGATSSQFKKRESNHRSDFKYESRKHATTRSTYMWTLKDRSLEMFENATVKWKIIRKCPVYSPVLDSCPCVVMKNSKS